MNRAMRAEVKLERCNPNPFELSHPNAFELSHPNPFGLSHPNPFGLSHPNPFGLSLSKPPASITPRPLRHGAFDKLSPLLRANGSFMRRGWRFGAMDH